MKLYAISYKQTPLCCGSRVDTFVGYIPKLYGKKSEAVGKCLEMVKKCHNICKRTYGYEEDEIHFESNKSKTHFNVFTDGCEYVYEIHGLTWKGNEPSK